MHQFITEELKLKEISAKVGGDENSTGKLTYIMVPTCHKRIESTVPALFPQFWLHVQPSKEREMG